MPFGNEKEQARKPARVASGGSFKIMGVSFHAAVNIGSETKDPP
ncbi:unnamed protein product, partial [marine sediment metagenome]